MLTKKEKDGLLKVYEDIVDRYYYYYNIDSFEREQYGRYIGIFNETEEKQIEMWIKYLAGDVMNLVYLGAAVALREDDMRYLDDALNTATTLAQLTELPLGWGCSWDIMSVLMSANRFGDIERIFPKEIGPSKYNGAYSAVMDLMMYLYYGEAEWKETAVECGRRALDRKQTIESKAIVACLMSLVEKDFDSFSAELKNVCMGRKRGNEYGDNKFTRQLPFFALGLYNFARYLYGEEAERKITFPTDAGLLDDLREYQRAAGYKPGGILMTFDKELYLLDRMFKIDLPTMRLRFEKNKAYADIERYAKEVKERTLGYKPADRE